jgi:hypothetical protein
VRGVFRYLQATWPAPGARQRRTNQTISETKALTISMLVNGAKNLKPGLSTRMSPGSRPKGSFASQGHRTPARTRSTPSPMSSRCMN